MDWRGCVYFWQLCSITKRKGFRGEVPCSYASASYIAAQLRGMVAADMESGREQAVSAGLIVDGDPVIIDGWHRQQTDPTGADRQARYRKKRNGASRVTRRDVTLRDGGVTTDLDRDRDGDTKIPGPKGPSSSPASPDTTTETVQTLFDHWRVVHNHGNAKLTSDRRSKVKARLRDGYTVQDITEAIEGALVDPALQQNERGVVYDDLATICKDGRTLERCRSYAGAPPVPKAAPQARKLTKTQDIRQQADGTWIDGYGRLCRDPNEEYSF